MGALLLAAACGEREAGARPDTEAAVGVTTRAAPITVPVTTGATRPSDCPADGRWHPCSATKRLEQAGLGMEREAGKDSTVREPGLGVPGAAYRVGRARLALFYYPSRAARERDQARLDSTRFVRWDQELTLASERTLIVSENLLAILDSKSGTQRERIANALTAGPPQQR